MNSEESFVIGTRKSRLAIWQANNVQSILSKNYPFIQWNVEGILSTGDMNLEISLSSFSDKGVFTKELDFALLNGSIDLAVHSMKDLPTILPEGIRLAAVLERADTRDCVIFSQSTKDRGFTSLDDLPDGSIIGTSSVRRRALLARKYPTLITKDIRGNLDTRFQKLEEQEYDAIVLAAAGVNRLGLQNKITTFLEVDSFPYATCQGALAVLCRDQPEDEELFQKLDMLNDKSTRICCEAERSMLRVLEGGCKVPVATRSTLNGDRLTLYGTVMHLTGIPAVETEYCISIEQQNCFQQAEKAGIEVARILIEKGAKGILEQVRHAHNSQYS